MNKREFYSSIAWRNLREYIRKRDGNLCQDCLKKGLISPAAEVHHIVPVTESNVNDPEITLNEDNLISLCKLCHAKRHKREKRYTVDEYGRVTTLEE